jgi:hypothetical protein
VFVASDSATSSSLVQRSPTARACVCLIVCDLETSTMRQPMPEFCSCTTQKKRKEKSDTTEKL